MKLTKGTLEIKEDGIAIVWQDLRVSFSDKMFISTIVKEAVAENNDIEATVCEELAELGLVILDDDEGYCTPSVLEEIRQDQRAEAEHINSYRSTYVTKANLI